MKNKALLLPVLLLSLSILSCNLVTNISDNMITPSDVNVSENRDVSGFDAIEFNTFGKLNIMQGDVESLNISGPDNIVPEIQTSVRNGTLVIDSRDNLTIKPPFGENTLTFTIVVKDLTSLNVSGLGGIEISGQAIQGSIEISGAGSVDAADLQLQTANVNVSGLGGATLWVTDQLTGDISGAGSVSYYGDPQTSTTSSGLGNFKSLGNK